MSRWVVHLPLKWQRHRQHRLWQRLRLHQVQQGPPWRRHHRPPRRPPQLLQPRRLPGRALQAVAVAVVARRRRLHLPHLPQRALPVEMGAIRRVPLPGPKPPPRNRHKHRLRRPVAQTPRPVATARPLATANRVEPRASPTRAEPRRLQGRQPAAALMHRQPARRVARR